MAGKMGKDRKGENSETNQYRAIAPYHLIREEYNSLLAEVSLRTDEETRRLLLMQSFTGRAQCGNGKHCKEEYVNTTLDDLVAVSEEIIEYWNLKKDTSSQELREFVKQKRQEKIDEAYAWVKSVLGGKNPTKLVNENGKPLFGIENFLEWQVKNPIDVLKGVYYGSRMDNYKWRKKTNRTYGLKIGGGSCYAIDFQRMHELSLNLKKLSKNEWSPEKIEEFKREKLIVGGDRVKTDERIRAAYIRKKRGQGVSDDMALIIAGSWHGTDTMLGVFMADAIDTWDKYVPYFYAGGLDERLGDIIEKSLSSSQLPTEKEVTNFIRLARKDQDIDIEIPDNSQRYLLQIERGSNQTALESHYRFVAREGYKQMVLGHAGSKTTNEELYDYVRKHL